ncbi:CBS domain-containing protein [Toxoplasma gondii ME49]|uniref:CBS domain-containing protein n=1 Tax=Toxoplasma gondii (strain ATCC 50611 / Me49) TaxID=508771 RepID=S8F4M7_TOXGM|nr:CBS domain-containing protein [Toxoplasma gondii ME49]EPT30746.1 CBS domain-containing protein [Toxoplasma gondii ME49]|eukprot:XP_018637640.1 CBS domain-containing protein [Toxoplasma gondii ME49]
MSRREEVYYSADQGGDGGRAYSGTSTPVSDRQAHTSRATNREGATVSSVSPNLLFQHVVQFFSHNEVVDVTPCLSKLLVIDHRLFVSTALQALKEFFYKPFSCSPFPPVSRRARPSSPAPAADDSLPACAEASPLSPPSSSDASSSGCYSARSSFHSKRESASRPSSAAAPPPATLGAAAFAGAASLASFSPTETGPSKAPSPSLGSRAGACSGGTSRGDEREVPFLAAGTEEQMRSEREERGARAAHVTHAPLERQQSLPVPCLRMRSELTRGVGAQGVWLYDEAAKVITGFMDDRELCAFFICWAYWLRAKQGPPTGVGAGLTGGKAGRNAKGGGDSSAASSRGTDGKQDAPTLEQRDEAGRGETEKREVCVEELSDASSLPARADLGPSVEQREKAGAAEEGGKTDGLSSIFSSASSPSTAGPAASAPASSPLPPAFSDDDAQAEDTILAILCGAPPPWTWTFQQWRAFYKTPSPVLYIEPNRPPLEALLLQLQNRSATVALWNDERQVPMIVITLRALLAHAVQHLRGDLPEFNLSVHHLRVGTYENLVTVDSEESILSVIETLDDCDISAVPVVNARGAYVGCFTRQNFLLLALQAIHNNTSVDLELPVGDAIAQLRFQEEQFEQQRQARAAAAFVVSSPDQTRLASSFYFNFRSSFCNNSVGSRPQDSGILSRPGYARPTVSPDPYSSYAPAWSGAAGEDAHVAGVQCSKKPAVLDSVVRIAKSRGSGQESRMPSGERKMDSQPGTTSSVSLKDALLRVLFSPYRRVIFLDHEDRVCGIVTASDLAEFLVGSGRSLYSRACAEECFDSVCSSFDERHEFSGRSVPPGFPLSREGASASAPPSSSTSVLSPMLTEKEGKEQGPCRWTAEPTQSTGTPATGEAGTPADTEKVLTLDRTHDSSFPSSLPGGPASAQRISSD